MACFGLPCSEHRNARGAQQESRVRKGADVRVVQRDRSSDAADSMSGLARGLRHIQRAVPVSCDTATSAYLSLSELALILAVAYRWVALLLSIMSYRRKYARYRQVQNSGFYFCGGTLTFGTIIHGGKRAGECQRKVIMLEQLLRPSKALRLGK
eukprot:4864428-Pleurochrysis_carterae.AAC.1